MTYRRQQADSQQLVELFSPKNGKPTQFHSQAQEYWKEICDLFDQVSKLAALEVIRDDPQRQDFIINVHARVVFCTTGYLASNFKTLSSQSFSVQSLVLLNAQTLSDSDAMLAASLCPSYERLVLTGPFQQRAGSSSILERLAVRTPSEYLSKLVDEG